MSKRMNIATPRKNAANGKTFWTNIGNAWFNDNGQIQLVFDALPIPDGEGRVVANLFEPREKQSGAAPGRSGGVAVSQFDEVGDAPF